MSTHSKTHKLPCRLEEVLRRLTAIFSEMRADGEVFLPSERILCELVGTSRMTVRKALDELEAKGKIETGARGRILVSRRTTEQLKGKVLFISSGREWIMLHAWNRLWARLNTILKPDGYDMDIKLYSEKSIFSAPDLHGYDFIILTNIPKYLRDDFAAALQGREGVITAYEGYADIAKHVIALDNHAAGCLGAELLLGAGYQRPALLYGETSYVGFVKRREGFQDACRRAGLKKPPMEFLLSMKTSSGYARDMMAAAKAITKTNCDSAFFVTDELIGLAYDIFARRYDIPEEFGLTTFAGVHEGIEHQPVITTVAHGTSRIATEIHQLMEDIRAGRTSVEGTRLLLEPGVHMGMTLRRNSNQKNKQENTP